MEKVLSVLMVCALALCLFTACSGGTTEAKPVADIYKQIEETVTLPELIDSDSNYIKNYYALDTADFEEYVFKSSADMMKADTIILIKAKDTDTVKKVEEQLGLILEQLKKENENYNPSEYEIINKGQLASKGNYVYLVISPDVDAIVNVINQNI